MDPSSAISSGVELFVQEQSFGDLDAAAQAILLETADYSYPSPRAYAIYDFLHRSDRENDAMARYIKTPKPQYPCTLWPYPGVPQDCTNRMALLCEMLISRRKRQVQRIISQTETIPACYAAQVIRALALSGDGAALLPDLIARCPMSQSQIMFEYCKCCMLMGNVREFKEHVRATSSAERQILRTAIIRTDQALMYDVLENACRFSFDQQVDTFEQLLTTDSSNIISRWFHHLNPGSVDTIYMMCETLQFAHKTKYNSRMCDRTVCTIPTLFMAIAYHAWFLPPKARNPALLERLVEFGYALDAPPDSQLAAEIDIHVAHMRANDEKGGAPKRRDSADVITDPFTYQHFQMAVGLGPESYVRLAGLLCGDGLSVLQGDDSLAVCKRTAQFYSIMMTAPECAWWFTQRVGFPDLKCWMGEDAAAIVELVRCDHPSAVTLFRYVLQECPDAVHHVFVEMPTRKNILDAVAQQRNPEFADLLIAYSRANLTARDRYYTVIRALTFDNARTAYALVPDAEFPRITDVINAVMYGLVSDLVGGAGHVPVRRVKDFISLFPAQSIPALCERIVSWMSAFFTDCDLALILDNCCLLAFEYGIPPSAFRDHDGHETPVSSWLLSRKKVDLLR